MLRKETKENNMDDENVDKSWLKKHAETLIVITSLFGGFFWMDSKFEKVNDRLLAVEKDVAVIKTILSFKGINCSELAIHDHRQEEERNKGK
jgi:hypothetical protein